MRKETSKRWSQVILFGLAILSGLCSPLLAANDSNSMELSVTADYFTKYIWRGQNINNGSVFQPSISIAKYGFTASVWGSLDLTTKNQHSGEFTEFDYSIDYSASIPDFNIVGFSVGALYYDFPNTTYEPTTEVYGGLNFDLPLAPYIKWYHDVQAINGSYIQLGVGHSIGKIWEIPEKCYCDLQIASSIGYGTSRYNKGYFDTRGGKMNDWTSSIALPFYIGAWSIKPSANYSMMLSDAVRTVTEKSDNFWVGLTISTEF